MANIHDVEKKLIDKIASALLRENTSEDFVHLAEAVYILLNCEEYDYLQEFKIESEPISHKFDLEKFWQEISGLYPKKKD